MRIWLLVLTCGLLPAADLPIAGISHVGFRVADLEKTRAFYAGTMGFQEAFEQKNTAGKVDLVVFKINDDQFLEFSPCPSGAEPDFTHVAFLSDKLEALRGLAEQLGLHPPELRTGRDHTRNFSIKDGDGHKVEFIRYEPDSLQALARGKFADGRRVSMHLHHLGLAMTDRSFWTEKLGFVATGARMMHPPCSAADFIEALPAGSKAYLGFDGAPARELHDPDGLLIVLK